MRVPDTVLQECVDHYRKFRSAVERRCPSNVFLGSQFLPDGREVYLILDTREFRRQTFETAFAIGGEYEILSEAFIRKNAARWDAENPGLKTLSRCRLTNGKVPLDA